MDTEEISYIIRCVLALVVLLGIAGAVFTFNVLLETPQFTNLLRAVGLY